MQLKSGIIYFGHDSHLGSQSVSQLWWLRMWWRRCCGCVWCSLVYFLWLTHGEWLQDILSSSSFESSSSLWLTHSTPRPHPFFTCTIKERQQRRDGIGFLICPCHIAPSSRRTFSVPFTPVLFYTHTHTQPTPLHFYLHPFQSRSTSRLFSGARMCDRASH